MDNQERKREDVSAHAWLDRRSGLWWSPLDVGHPLSWVSARGLPVGGALLDSGPAPSEDPRARFSALCLTPTATLRVEALDERGRGPGGEDPLSALEAFAHEGACAPTALTAPLTPAPLTPAPLTPAPLTPAPLTPAPLTVCAISYECGRAVERLPPPSPPREGAPERLAPPLPALWAARYDAAYVWDALEGRGWLVGRSVEALCALAARLSATGDLSAPAPVSEPVEGALTLTPLTPLWSQAEHAAAVEEAQVLMGAGEIYQVNLTTPMRAPLREGVSVAQVYGAMRARNPAAFGLCARLDERRAVLSLSPERLLRWSAEGEVSTEPIKGTRPRHTDALRDAEERRGLLESLKDRAEHMMIVDLERNDLGRVCEVGSVRVEALRALRTYPTLHHLVSVISGRLRPQVGLADLLRATFPGGSVVGAPKARAMEVIARLEPAARGVYCGALGYLDPRGGGDLNLPIRTAWISGGELFYHAGGGVVADSTAEGEWAELWVKSAAASRGLGW